MAKKISKNEKKSAEKKTKNVIVVKNVTKQFTIYEDRAIYLKEVFLHPSRLKRRKRTILKDIDFNIKSGETVALIGVNGSGKSTLLKVLSRIIYPERGSVKINGKVSSLLELGAGFNMDFTGRENIYFNASIYGLGKKDVDKVIDKIIEFSELGDFIDQPVRVYSSGMYMRLAFSIAVNVEAEILLIDEILAVGDAHFQAKCLAKMKELKASGKTMVFVSHAMNTVEEFCDRAIWLKDGVVKMDGPSHEVGEAYLKEQGL